MQSKCSGGEEKLKFEWVAYVHLDQACELVRHSSPMAASTLSMTVVAIAAVLVSHNALASPLSIPYGGTESGTHVHVFACSLHGCPPALHH